MKKTSKRLSVLLLLVCLAFVKVSSATEVILGLANEYTWGGSGSNRVLSWGTTVPASIFTFTITNQATPTAPYITAATLTDANVTWTDPLGATTNSKTPAASFFTSKAGTYKLAVSDWSKVTVLFFAQAAVRPFLLSLHCSSLITNMTGLTGINFYFNDNDVDWDMGVLPSTVTAISYAWNKTKEKDFFPVISNCIKCTSLAQAWQTSVSMTGDFPYVNSMTNVTTIAYAWEDATNHVGVMPAVSNLTKLTSFGYAWRGNSAITGAFPYVNSLTNVTYGYKAWEGASSCVAPPPEVSNLVKLQMANTMWRGWTVNTNRPPMIDTCTNINTCAAAWDASPLFPSMPLTNTLPYCTDYYISFRECNSMVGNIGDWTWRSIITRWSSQKSQIGYTNRPGCFVTNVANGILIDMYDSKLPQGDVSQILIDLDASGATNGTINIGGTTAGWSNATPSAAGITAATNLFNKGWIVTINQ